MKILKSLPALLTTFAIAACGGGSGSNDGNGGGGVVPPPSNGIVRTGMVIGPIASFGSVVVNGVHYETNAATITVDGQPATQADLRVGQVVSMVAELEDGAASGTASSVSFDDNVEGPIESIDAASGVLIVLGQTVRIGTTTSFDDSIQPRSLDGLAVGDVVEVSGLVRADGSIDATRIELKAAGSEFEVHGVVAALDAANLQFNLNALVVDYSGAQLDDFPGGSIADGQAVEAKGTTLDANGALIATRVEFKGALVGGAQDDFAEIEGYITRFASAQDFDVSGLCVTTGAATTFEGGAAADLGLDVKVEVEGIFDGGGCLSARKVDIRLGTAVRVTALIDSIDVANDSLVLLGIPVDIDSLTRMEDQSDADVEPLTLNDLAVGNYLEIRGGERPAGSGRVQAALLEREDLDTETELQGFVTAVTAPTLTILGVTIQTDGSTQYRDVNDSPLSAAEFFNQVAIGSLVKADGAENSSSTILASEVELED